MILLYMTPRIAARNIPNGFWCQSVFLRYMLPREAIIKFRAYYRNVSFGKFGFWVFRSDWLPSLFDHVSHICIMIAKEKVRNFTALSIIALMEHKKPIRNRTICQLPSKAMSRDPRSISIKLPVPLINTTALPLEATRFVVAFKSAKQSLCRCWPRVIRRAVSTETPIMHTAKASGDVLPIASLNATNFCYTGFCHVDLPSPVVRASACLRWLFYYNMVNYENS